MKSSRSVPSQDVPAKKNTKRKAVASAAKAPVEDQKNKIFEDSREQVALRAYFIGERRRSLGIAGDETSDWVQAEQELSRDLAGR
jgi:hypothetical protein